MMNACLTLFCLLLMPGCFAQPQFRPDTATDYQQRFYVNGKLKSYDLPVYIDSANRYYTPEEIAAYGMDTAKLLPARHKVGIDYYDEDWKKTDSAYAVFYQLGETVNGTNLGKSYSFDREGRLVQIIIRYPMIGGVRFRGLQRLFFREDGTLEKAAYQRFPEDDHKGLYINKTTYYPNGKIHTYRFTDELNNIYGSLDYDETGLCYYEVSIDSENNIKIRRENGGTVEIRELYDGPDRCILTFKNGTLVDEKMETW
jgi:hypothetical protein